MLKKEFNKKEVQRMRNLIQGKSEEKTGSSSRYSKPKEFYSEGDIWEEDGRKWTIKEGIKQNITKLDKARALNIPPLFCPNCTNLMKKRFDPDYYKVHKMCFDCVIDFEHDLKKAGLYVQYEKNIHNADLEGFIKGYKNWVLEQINETSNSFISENGDLENWIGGVDKEKILDSLNKTIENLEKLKK